jgi:probable F420-dependent oxidoreductase
MRLGLHALGIGVGAQRAVIDAAARAAEDGGFSTLWAGEHVVMFDRPSSRYPYAPDGQIAVPPDADWLDPLVCLSFVAAATHTTTVATGIVLLAEHNPLLVAKQAASLDVLSGGRLMLGVGIGWSADEFAALGVAFSGRAQRTVEHVEVMRTLWRADLAPFDGRFVRFDAVRVYPKPARNRRVPVIFGTVSRWSTTGPRVGRLDGLGDAGRRDRVDHLGHREPHLRRGVASRADAILAH